MTWFYKYIFFFHILSMFSIVNCIYYMSFELNENINFIINEPWRSALSNTLMRWWRLIECHNVLWCRLRLRQHVPTPGRAAGCARVATGAAARAGRELPACARAACRTARPLACPLLLTRRQTLTRTPVVCMDRTCTDQRIHFPGWNTNVNEVHVTRRKVKGKLHRFQF